MTRATHQSWCDRADHEREVQTSGASPDDCSSAMRTVIPGWNRGADTIAWVTSTEGNLQVFTDLPGAGMLGLCLSPAEAREVGRLLTEGTVEQVRAWGTGLLHFAALVEQEAVAAR